MRVQAKYPVKWQSYVQQMAHKHYFVNELFFQGGFLCVTLLATLELTL